MQNAFGFSAPPGPLAATGGCLLLRGEEREGEKGRKGIVRGKQRKERQGKRVREGRGRWPWCKVVPMVLMVLLLTA